MSAPLPRVRCVAREPSPVSLAAPTVWRHPFLILAFLVPACAPGEPAPPGDYSHWNWPLQQKNSAGWWVSRSYLVHIPPQANARLPLPVVINLHPAYNNGGLQNLYSGMNAKADREGFIAIHPDSIGRPCSSVR